MSNNVNQIQIDVNSDPEISENDEQQNERTQTTDIKTLVLNCRSIQSKKKQQQIRALVNTNNPDITILTETWLNKNFNLREN